MLYHSLRRIGYNLLYISHFGLRIYHHLGCSSCRTFLEHPAIRSEILSSFHFSHGFLHIVGIGECDTCPGSVHFDAFPAERILLPY